MENNLEVIARLINKFTKLPGVGGRTAQRYAYSVINMKAAEVDEFAQSLLEVKEKIAYCTVCGNFTEKGADPCGICRGRENDVICVVKEPKDVLALERMHGFRGVYHVLHGTINPLEGKGPDDIRIKELLARVTAGGVSEIVMATNPDVEGEATAAYIARLLKPFGAKVTRIAQGVSMGSELEYVDEVTLSRAFEDRKQI